MVKSFSFVFVSFVPAHIVLQGHFPHPQQAHIAVVVWFLVVRNDLRVYQQLGRGRIGMNPMKLRLLPPVPEVVLLLSVVIRVKS